MNELNKLINKLIENDKIEFYSGYADIIKLADNVFLRKLYADKEDAYVPIGKWAARKVEKAGNQSVIHESLHLCGDYMLDDGVSIKLTLLSANLAATQDEEMADYFVEQIRKEMGE